MAFACFACILSVPFVFSLQFRFTRFQLIFPITCEIPMRERLLSVILLSFNRLELTRKALENVRHATARLDAEILVVDNASTDGTREFLQSVACDDVRIIQNETKLFFGGGNNVGLSEANGKYILFTQNDFYFAENSIRLLIDCHEYLPESGIVGVGGGLVTPHGITELSDWWKNPLRRFDFIPVDFISGCCMLAERDFLVSNAIRFDENYVLYWEDVDFSNQVLKAGRNLYMVSNALAHTRHLRSSTITPLLGEGVREKIRSYSSAYYHRKWEQVSVHRQSSIIYGIFGSEFAFRLESDGTCAVPNILPDELLPHQSDISAIQGAEYLEMLGRFEDAEACLLNAWENGETNYMALRNLCRIKRSTGGRAGVHQALELLEKVLPRDIPPLLYDKLLKHQKLAREQLALCR